MRKMLLVTLVLVPLLTGSAFAQAGPGDLGIFFDPAGTQSTAFPPPSSILIMYVVAFDTPGAYGAYEGSITYDYGALILLSATFAPPGSINIGTNENWMVVTGSCLPGAGPVVLVTFQFFLIYPAFDSLVCLGPATPSSFAPPTPGYFDCISDPYPFGVAQNGGSVYPNGCAVINPLAPPPPPIAVEAESWGAVKTRF